MTTITIRDESTGVGHEDRVFTLEMPGESMTVRELIRERVYQEVDDYNRAMREQGRLPILGRIDRIEDGDGRFGVAWQEEFAAMREFVYNYG